MDWFDDDEGPITAGLVRGNSLYLSGTFLSQPVDPEDDWGFGDDPATGVLADSVLFSFDGAAFTGDGVSLQGQDLDIYKNIESIAEGPHTVVIRWTEITGNYGYAIYRFVIDRTPPTITWFDQDGNILEEGGIFGNPGLEITAGFWDLCGMQEFEPYSYSSNIYYDTYFGAYVYTWNTPLGTYFILSSYDENTRTYSFVASATDLAGNCTGTQTIHLTMNVNPRVIDVSPLDGSWSNTASPEIWADFITPIGSLDGGVFKIDDVEVDFTTNGQRLSVDAPSLSDGSHTISVIGHDTSWSAPYPLQHASAEKQWTVNIDTVPPTLTSATITDGILTVSASDATSGVSFIDLKIDGSNGHFSPFALDGDPLEFDTSEMAPGEYDVMGTIVDAANNVYRFSTRITKDENDETDLDDVDEPTAIGVAFLRCEWISPIMVKPHVVKPGEEVWVGEQVMLVVQPIETNDDPPITWSWTVSGARVRDYTTSKASGAITPLTHGGNGVSSNMDTQGITFYWWDTGTEAQTVSCSLTFLQQEPAAPSIKINVRKPTCQFSLESNTLLLLPGLTRTTVFN